MSISGFLFTKRLCVLLPDLMKSRSSEIGCYNGNIALKVDTLSSFRAIGTVYIEISRLRDFTRCCGKTSVGLVNTGPARPVSLQPFLLRKVDIAKTWAAWKKQYPGGTQSPLEAINAMKNEPVDNKEIHGMPPSLEHCLFKGYNVTCTLCIEPFAWHYCQRRVRMMMTWRKTDEINYRSNKM